VIFNEILMPKDKALVSVYVPQETKEKLEAWAEEEDRSVSYIVGRLITESLEAREKQPPASGTRGGKGKGGKGGKG
jgi:molybdopterin-guanine dinucleotide biosynthesis protein A